MSNQKTPRRVAFVSRDKSEFAYNALLGVLAFREQVEHWQLLGPADAPVINFEDLDLAQVDGVIGFIRDPRKAQALADAAVPTVNISNVFQDLPLPRIGHDDEQIGRLGGEHLLERGFSHFGFIAESGLWLSQRRLDGFRSVIETGVGRVCHVLQRDDGRTPTPDEIGRWMSDLPKPVAIMAAYDGLGLTAILRATELGLRVPDDVAVLGVDNDRWLTRMSIVPMSSIETDGQQVGHRAARLLDGLMSGELPPPPRWIAPIGVVSRRSTDIVLSDDPIVEQALQFIRDRCVKGIGIEDVLDALGVSRRKLELHLKQATGMTPRVAIFRAQVEHARKMLVGTDQPLYAIAQACGFNRQDRFSIVFKRIAGMTPGEYRRRYGTSRG